MIYSPAISNVLPRVKRRWLALAAAFIAFCAVRAGDGAGVGPIEAVRGSRAVNRPKKPDSSPVASIAGAFGLPVRLVEAVIRVESAWNPYAVSRRGAAGLMQLMPWHTRTMRNPFDPSENVWTGCGLLAECLKIEHGDIRRALMRYNAGQWNGITGYAYATKILKEMEEGS